MKKPKLNFNYKKFISKQKESDWQKSVYFLLIFATFALVGMLVYIYFSQPSQQLKERIQEEISIESIKIDTNTLNKIIEREYLK